MGSKIVKSIAKTVTDPKKAATFLATGGLSQIKDIKDATGLGYGELATIAGTAALTGGAAAAAGLSGAGIAGAAAAGVGMTAPKAIAAVEAEKKAKAEQDAYNKAVNAENERQAAQTRANLLSLRKQYTQSTTKGFQGGGSSNGSVSGETTGGIILG